MLGLHMPVFTIKNPGVTQTSLSILRALFFSRPSLFTPPNFFAVVRSTQFHPSNFSCFPSTSLPDALKSAAERVHQRNQSCWDYFFFLFPCWFHFRDVLSGGGKQPNAWECLQILLQGGGVSNNIISEASFNNIFLLICKMRNGGTKWG